MSQWNDRYDEGNSVHGNEHGNADGDWTAPGSEPHTATPGAYGQPGSSPERVHDGRQPYASAPVGATPEGAFHRVGPGGVPELWPGPIPLRPLGIWETIETAFRVVRYSPKTLFGLTFVVLLVTIIVSSVVILGITSAVTGMSNPFAMEDDGSFTGGLGINLISMVIGLISFFLSGLLIVPIAESALGRRLSAGASWNRIKPRILPLLGYLVLTSLLYLAAFIPVAALVAIGAAVGDGLLTGVLAAIGGVLTLVAFVILSLRLSLAPAAIVLEGVGPVTALKRSWRLTAGAFWRIFGTMFLVQMITGAISYLLMIVLMLIIIAAALAASAGGSETVAGVATMIGVALGLLITYTITLPLSAAVTALIYMDRRFRTEGLAVDLLAEAERQRTRA